MKIIEKVLDVICEILKWVVAFLVFAMVALTFIEVIRRYGFSKTWPWSEELVRYMIVYSTFLGGPVAYRRGALTCFDLVLKKMPQKVQDILAYVNNTIVIAMCAFILRYGIKVVNSASIKLQISASLHISMSIVYWSIPIGMILMILFGIEQYFKIYQRIKTRNQKGEVAV